jgi:hypothetical protein
MVLLVAYSPVCSSWAGVEPGSDPVITPTSALFLCEVQLPVTSPERMHKPPSEIAKFVRRMDCQQQNQRNKNKCLSAIMLF